MHLVVRRLDGGERAPFLLDSQGVPLTWPTLFATVRLRNAGRAVNSIRNKLYELTVLLRWEQLHGRDLETEFRDGRLLSVPDVVSIRDFAAKKLGRADSTSIASDRVARLPEAGLAPRNSSAPVSKQVHYNRMTTIADFVAFLGQAVTVHRSDRNLAAEVDRMAKRLRQHRPSGTRPSQSDPEQLCPSSALVHAFVSVGSEGHPENPFRRGSIQRRNGLMLRLLLETGIRLGELLSLRLDYIETGEKPTISVRRTHDDRHDSRAYQPVAKTMERTIGISEQLGVDIHRYCMEDRAGTPGAKRHPYLFVTHRKGRTCGQPLSMSAVANRVFGPMQQVRPGFSSIHPHSFRHYANYRLSIAVDKLNRKAREGNDPTNEPISDGRESRVRAHLNGHRSTKSGEVYNQRHVRETTDKISHAIQEDLMERAKQSSVGDDDY